MLKEFREFALKGNVVDLAVGVIIGAAFGKIVASMVEDILMPIIGWIAGGLDFSNYFLPLVKGVTAASYADAKAQGAVIGYGQFLTISINFIIVAWVLFVVIKAVNKLRRQAPPPPAVPAAPPEDVALLREIRDLLAKTK
ncbi:large conductance mechanosensitive channel protein MscL [Elstera cyanobacteriorum]|uniref:large conductance mechanosensitive channel protein MscL n=1 Tax=Elstera cyanobacteriorum TaxID=2022747 RepID=UPI00235557BE|nr:large conductance mechanosensitive channel protein MscL [Elstera cyanobacteriorum]MCK6444525.1 large conductance mechanosensitive channel protein MscL [Elstera cyanobacteriorum]